MKIDKFFSWLLLSVVLCSFCACSSDDEEGEGTGSNGAVTLNIGGVKTNLGNVYWMAESYSQGKNHYELQFMSFDLYAYMAGGDYSSLPSSYSVVYISFEAPGSLAELPVGTFEENDYELSGVLDASLDNGEGRYYVEEGSASGNLVITKAGDNYTVTISPLEVVYSDPADVGQGNWMSTTMNWNYTGKIKKAPEE